MKHRAWFLLLLKGIGVFLVAFSLPDLWYIGRGLVDAGLNGPDAALTLLSNGGLILQPAIGLYLIFGGKRLAEIAIRDAVIFADMPGCPHCGYDTTGATADRCPECGHDLPTPQPRGATDDEPDTDDTA